MQSLLDELGGDRPSGEGLPDHVVYSDHYLLLLGLAGRGLPEDRLIQFAIVAASRVNGQELIFLSRWHAVTRPSL